MRWLVPASPRDRFPTAAGTGGTKSQSQTTAEDLSDRTGLTGASVGGDAAHVSAAPRFHGNRVQPTGRQRREDALVVSRRDTLVLQDRQVVADQHHVAVQISSGVAPVHLRTGGSNSQSQSAWEDGWVADPSDLEEVVSGRVDRRRVLNSGGFWKDTSGSSPAPLAPPTSTFSLTCSRLHRRGVLQAAAPRHYDDRVQPPGNQRVEGALGRRGVGHGQSVDGPSPVLKTDQVAVNNADRWSPGQPHRIRPAAVADGDVRHRRWC